jgi:hypothetical protein
LALRGSTSFNVLAATIIELAHKNAAESEQISPSIP